MAEPETIAVRPLSTRLANFPVSFFAVVMGLLGLVIATQKMEELLGIRDIVSTVLLGIALLVFLVLACTYSLKLVRHPAATWAEFDDPVRLSFFPTISVGLLLTSIAFLPLSKTTSLVFWLLGTVIHLVLTLVVLSMWVRQPKFEIKHMNPAWFIPVVGNILVPLAGVTHAPVQVSWFFFSIGVVFWLILQTLFFYRAFFHHPLPERLLPTLFILLAPPAVAFVAYVKVTGAVDGFANVLYYFALFVFLFLIGQLGMLRKVRFFLSWWAYSFPLAAFTVASVLMHRQTGLLFFEVVSWVIFVFLVAVILLLAVLTLRSVARSQICVEE